MVLQRLYSINLCLLGISLSCLHRRIQVICIWRSALLIFCFSVFWIEPDTKFEGLDISGANILEKIFKMMITLWPFGTIQLLRSSSANNRNKATQNKYKILWFLCRRSTWDANWSKRINKVLKLRQNTHKVCSLKIGW